MDINVNAKIITTTHDEIVPVLHTAISLNTNNSI